MKWWEYSIILAAGAYLFLGDEEDTVPKDDDDHDEPEGPVLPNPGTKSRRYPRRQAPGVPPGQWVQLQTTAAFRVRNTRRSWVTTGTASTLRQAAERFNTAGNPLGFVPPLQIQLNDASKEGGGKLSGHASHKHGRDMDIVLVGLQGQRLPSIALPTLLESFLADENVQVIFLDWQRQREVWDALEANPELAPNLRAELQYPLPPHKGKTRVRHWPSHRNHLHVRTIN